MVTITFPIGWTTACTVLISKETSQNRLIVHTCFVHQWQWLMHSCQNIWHWFLGYWIWMTTSCTNIPYLDQPGIGTFICLLVVVSWMDSYTHLCPSQPPFWLWFYLGSSLLVSMLLYLCLLSSGRGFFMELIAVFGSYPSLSVDITVHYLPLAFLMSICIVSIHVLGPASLDTSSLCTEAPYPYTMPRQMSLSRVLYTRNSIHGMEDIHDLALSAI